MTTTFLDPISEKSSGIYTATLTDGLGTAIPGSTIQALTLSLYDTASGGVINYRLSQNCLNTNNVTLDLATGVLVWSMQPLDNVLVGSGTDNELHAAEFYFTWGSGAFALSHKILFVVEALVKLT